MFHVKHRVFLRTLSPFNARLNYRRKAAELVLRMFQLHVVDQAGLSLCSGSFRLQSETTREDLPILRQNVRASCAHSFSLK